MTIHSQEDLHLGNHLLRHLPFSTNARHCVGSVCVLVSEKLSPLVSLARPPTFSNLPSSKRHVVTHYLPHFVSCLPLPTLGEWVVWSPPTLFQGSSALTQSMRSCISISTWLVKIYLLQKYCAFYLRRTTVRMYLFSIFMKYLGKNTFTQRSTFMTTREAFPP